MLKRSSEILIEEIGYLLWQDSNIELVPGKKVMP